MDNEAAAVAAPTPVPPKFRWRRRIAWIIGLLLLGLLLLLIAAGGGL